MVCDIESMQSNGRAIVAMFDTELICALDRAAGAPLQICRDRFSQLNIIHS